MVHNFFYIPLNNHIAKVVSVGQSLSVTVVAVRYEPFKSKITINFESNYRKWDNDWSALSYLINHKSLYKLNEIKKNNKYKTFEGVMAADNYLFRFFNTYVYKYPYFTFPKNNESTIHRDHLLYHSIYKNINYLILENNAQYLY